MRVRRRLLEQDDGDARENEINIFFKKKEWEKKRKYKIYVYVQMPQDQTGKRWNETTSARNE